MKKMYKAEGYGQIIRPEVKEMDVEKETASRIYLSNTRPGSFENKETHDRYWGHKYFAERKDAVEFTIASVEKEIRRIEDKLSSARSSLAEFKRKETGAENENSNSRLPRIRPHG